MRGTEDDRASAAGAREARLAEALRANLRRRKAQAKARAAAPEPPDTDGTTHGNDDSAAPE